MARLVLALMLCSSIGCGLLPPPGWVEDPPSQDGWIYAVGSAGLTYDKNPSTSEDLAFQRALDQLARQLRVQVTSMVTLKDTQSSSRFESDSMQFTEEELEWVQIRDKWVDRYGKLGRQGRVFVLVRMSDGDARRALTRRG